MEHSAATVEKAIDVLFHLHERAEPWGVTELSRALRLPKSSVHRLLVSLRRRGLVESDERGRYRPGIVLVALGLGVLEREPLVVAARPVIELAAAQLDETFFAVAARAGALTVLDKAEGTGFLRAAPHVGQIIPVAPTAVGRLYLAYAPDAVRTRDEVPFGIARLRGLDMTQPEERDLALIRRRGYAENLNAWTEGLAVFAAPVFLHARLVGTIAAALPAPHLERVEKKRVIEHVMRAAARVGARMEGHER